MSKRCKYLDVPPDKDGNVRVRIERIYSCMWNEPISWPPIPVSWVSFGDLGTILFTGRRDVDAEDCAACPVRENVK